VIDRHVGWVAIPPLIRNQRSAPSRRSIATGYRGDGGLLPDQSYRPRRVCHAGGGAIDALLAECIWQDLHATRAFFRARHIGCDHDPMPILCTSINTCTTSFAHPARSSIIRTCTNAQEMDDDDVWVAVHFEPDRLFTIVGQIDAERRRNWVEQLTAARPHIARILGGERAADKFVEAFLGFQDRPDTSSYTALFFVRGTAASRA
jgi:hypothetical protein